MKVVLFCHSLLSDWNHGNAHFLRGVCSELARRGHRVLAWEPADAWSLRNLLRHEGPRRLDGHLEGLRRAYPDLAPIRYDPDDLDVDRALDGADLVLVHEWNDPELIRRLGEHRRRHGSYRLLFHDTHHRSVTDPGALDRVALEDYDGVLAFGEAVAELHRRRGWGRRAWTWHEAADDRVFRPLDRDGARGLVWIGNWGDEERTPELREFLLEPVRELGLAATVHGVRYPDEGIEALRRAGATYRGWLPNHRVPEAFARHGVTVHVPRRPYLDELRGVPTIRPFEAMACGIPLVSARWDDPHGLFRAGEDFLVARDGAEMTRHLRALARNPDLRDAVARSGRATVLARHTCRHRVDELLDIHDELEGVRAPPEPAGRPPRPGPAGENASSPEPSLEPLQEDR